MTDDDLQYLRDHAGGTAKRVGVAIAVDRVEDGFAVSQHGGCD